jgi:hypothetical protein
MQDDWEILPNGLLSKSSFERLKREREQSQKEMIAYQNSKEFKEYSKEKDKQLDRS